MKSVYKFAAIGGILALFLAACATVQAPPIPVKPVPTGTSASALVDTEGTTELADITPASVPATASHIRDFGSDRDSQLAVITHGLGLIRVFTLDYAIHQTRSGALTDDTYMSLMPSFEKNIKPKVSEPVWKDFVQRWEVRKSGPLYLANLDSESGEYWVTKEGGTELKCLISDKPWATTFSDPRLTAEPYAPASGGEPTAYNVTKFQITARYLIPCADGKVLTTGDRWELTYQPDGTLYDWKRASTGITTTLSQQ
ncbi:hypothetical protein [Pseudarthrobacter sp. NamE5]|uniref:hypothetical protein n=1 Tax=Pseudarthrobacter sp. NamE5 TaxID=2576839 RepID=UPI00110A8DB4|nr:hypothetical protein [Pseudarthrobacter sp. NamE5]TLM83223.1 hypothetical protein FDW84_14495 [Pseudarthrobacter sp. NamE5]